MLFFADVQLSVYFISKPSETHPQTLHLLHTTLRGDITATIALMHDRQKHIDKCYHWIQQVIEQAEQGSLCFVYCPIDRRPTTWSPTRSPTVSGNEAFNEASWLRSPAPDISDDLKGITTQFQMSQLPSHSSQPLFLCSTCSENCQSLV